MNRDGSNLVRLTNNPAIDTSPTWSPSGTQIAFTSDRSGSPQIYIIDADGLNLNKITAESWCDRPTWSPAPFNEIAYASRTGPGYDIRIYDLATQERRQLTGGPGQQREPRVRAERPARGVHVDADGQEADLRDGPRRAGAQADHHGREQLHARLVEVAVAGRGHPYAHPIGIRRSAHRPRRGVAGARAPARPRSRRWRGRCRRRRPPRPRPRRRPRRPRPSRRSRSSRRRRSPRTRWRRAPSTTSTATPRCGSSYFDYDSAELSAEARAALDANAALLKKYPVLDGHHRGPLRRARHRRVQPGPRRAPGRRGAVVPGGARHPGQPREDRQLREGVPVRSRPRRGRLGQEPARALRHHREVVRPQARRSHDPTPWAVLRGGAPPVVLGDAAARGRQQGAPADDGGHPDAAAAEHPAAGPAGRGDQAARVGHRAPRGAGRRQPEVRSPTRRPSPTR